MAGAHSPGHLRRYRMPQVTSSALLQIRPLPPIRRPMRQGKMVPVFRDLRSDYPDTANDLPFTRSGNPETNPPASEAPGPRWSSKSPAAHLFAIQQELLQDTCRSGTISMTACDAVVVPGTSIIIRGALSNGLLNTPALDSPAPHAVKYSREHTQSIRDSSRLLPH